MSKRARPTFSRIAFPRRLKSRLQRVRWNRTKALLRSSELNLEYAVIRAPISGRIGDSLRPVGGLVSKASGYAATTIPPIDPIWVRFKISESEYLTYQDRHDSGDPRRAISKAPLEIVLANGMLHPYPGHIQNTVNQVDQKTRTLGLQATFPNPRHNLLPGQFGRIRFLKEERHDALLVPQRAVLETQGLQSVFVVSRDNKVLLRSLVPGDRVGDRWIVNQGLKPGDRVVVGGRMKIRPGMTVTSQPWIPQPGAPKNPRSAHPNK